MNLWVLDTDTLTLLFHGHAEVQRRVAATPPQELSVSIISVEETLTGWYTEIRKARDDARLVRAYTALQEAIEFIRQTRILPFDQLAAERFRQLRPLHRRTGTNDLRIAAVAMEQHAILVTRNRSDFATIAGLALEDWSQVQHVP